MSATTLDRRRFGASAVSLVLSLTLLACGDDDHRSATGWAAAGFPVTVDNCGESVTFQEPPRRAFGYYQNPTELMLALGLQDSMVGTAYPDNAVLPRYRAAYEEIPEVSKQDASFEQVLQTEPDFVFGGYESAFDDAQGRSRKAFADNGINTYVNPEECATSPIMMDDVFEEVRTIAGIFGVPERASSLIDDMRANVEGTRRKLAGVAPVKVFVYDSGEDAAFTAGGRGIGNQIIEFAGGENVFADVDSSFADVSWEQVLQRDPDVIAIYDYFGTPSVEDKKAFLLGRPELANVSAIRDKRFVVLTLQDAVLGIRAPFAVEHLAKQMHPDLFR